MEPAQTKNIGNLLRAVDLILSLMLKIILIAFVPILNLWYAIEVLFLRGMEGDNRFGVDPLGIASK